MKFPTYNHKEVEEQILAFWKHNNVTDHLRNKNKGKQKFYFLDGPPYTSGRIHLGHAWNKTLKDMVLRYKRMQGFDVWDRAGFDMHGLPTEHKTMAKFGLKNKEDIEQFGYEQFSQECYNYCTEMMQAMIKDFERIGTTLDYSDPDQPIKNERMEQVWAFIKKAHEDGRLYLGKRALHWDPKDGSALAKHELEYKDITDESIYLKFKLVNHENTSLLIWTTTPWTIPLNLVAVVHPDFEYAKCQVGNEVWIVAKELAQKVINEIVGKEYTILEVVKGSELEGEEYIAPFKGEFREIEEAREQNPLVYTVLLSSDAVHLEEGTGLVHFAPGCGESDYELCIRNGIEPFNPIDENGIYPQEPKIFAGLVAKTDDAKFIELMKENGTLIAQKKIRHSYPHGERSKAPVIFRTTEQWFLKVVDLKEKMLANNDVVNWQPQAGKNSFHSWLSGLRDNSITKQRFWGTPIPLWQSQDGDILVIGSVDELKSLAKTPVPKNLHKPWIDDVIIEKDGKEYKRLPDVLDVWIDPGCQSWIMLGQENMDRFYPVDFIVEGKDQIRAWFNLLWICSHLYLDVPAFENVFMHGFVTDVDGVKMSKSLGNIISPYEIIDKHGADTMRVYMAQTGAGEDINFSWDECSFKSRQLLILWNVHKLLLTTCNDNAINPFTLDKNLMFEMMGVEEKYIISKLSSTIKKVTTLMNEYRLNEIIAPLEELYLELSRTYIQMVRDRLNGDDKEVAIFTIAHVLFETCKMLSILTPFVSEAIYLNMKEQFGLQEQSISHYPWPRVDDTHHNPELEEQMQLVQSVIAAGLAAREKAKLGVRWPVKEVVVVTKNSVLAKASESLRDIIMAQLNAKSISVMEDLPGLRLTLEPVAGKIGSVFGALSQDIIATLKEANVQEVQEQLHTLGKYRVGDVDITADMVKILRHVPELFAEGSCKSGFAYINTQRSDELEAEGFSREVMRNVQNARKKAGLTKTQQILLFVKADEEMVDALTRYADAIVSKVGATSVEFTTQDAVKEHEHSNEFKVKGRKFNVFFDVVKD